MWNNKNLEILFYWLPWTFKSDCPNMRELNRRCECLRLPGLDTHCSILYTNHGKVFLEIALVSFFFPDLTEFSCNLIRTHWLFNIFNKEIKNSLKYFLWKIFEQVKNVSIFNTQVRVFIANTSFSAMVLRSNEVFPNVCFQNAFSAAWFTLENQISTILIQS